MATIKLEWTITSNPDLSGYNFFVEAGKDFDADDYAAAYALNRADIDPEDVHQAQDAAARLTDVEWLAVTHEILREDD